MLPKSNSHFKRMCQSTRSGFTWGPDSVFLKDYRNQTHIVQVRREHVVNGNTVLSQSKSNFPKGKPRTPKNHLLRHYAAKFSKDVFWVFIGKRWFWRENQLFPRKKMVLGRKTNFFLGKRWFWTGKPIFPRENQKHQKNKIGKLYSQTPKRWYPCFP